MITVSSNLATNLLLEKLAVDDIRGTVHSLRADGMNVLRGVEDDKAFKQGLNNTTTARGLLQLLDSIARGQAVDQESSRQVSEILERQSFNDGISAGLPAGTRVAHKTGEITRIHHDAGIVFAPRPFVLVILVCYTRWAVPTVKITAISHSIRELHRISVTLSESQGGGSHYAESVHILEVNVVKYIRRRNAKRWPI